MNLRPISTIWSAVTSKAESARTSLQSLKDGRKWTAVQEGSSNARHAFSDRITRIKERAAAWTRPMRTDMNEAAENFIYGTPLGRTLHQKKIDFGFLKEDATDAVKKKATEVAKSISTIWGKMINPTATS